ncbi:MAG: phage head closure protein [Hyphomicrobium sp.]|nr:phage head closure protein [Hyphomicrobium sp.]
MTQAGDGQGGFTETWATEATLWAAIEPTKGYERYQAQQVQMPVTHKITIRYRSGVTTKKRFLFGSRVFEIKEVLNQNEANEFLELRAVEMT